MRYTVALNISGQNDPIITFSEASSKAEALGQAVILYGITNILGWAVTLNNLDEELRVRVQVYIDNNQRIAAIKEVREATNWGLKESKNWVDSNFPY